MLLILGGKYMGKLEYARGLCERGAAVFDMADMEMNMDVNIKKMLDARIIINLQEGIRTMLERGLDARKFFGEYLGRLEEKNKILVGDEIGSGVIPMDPFERHWRDETGFIYQMLARHAEIVDRVWAGLPVRLKGPG
jgi:hypothetical protein